MPQPAEVYLLNVVSLFGDSDARRCVSLIGLTVEEWSDSNSHFNASSTLPTDALSAEFLAVASIAIRVWIARRTVLVLQFVGELSWLGTTDLRLEAIIVALLELHLCLLLLLEPV